MISDGLLVVTWYVMPIFFVFVYFHSLTFEDVSAYSVDFYWGFFFPIDSDDSLNVVDLELTIIYYFSS